MGRGSLHFRSGWAWFGLRRPREEPGPHGLGPPRSPAVTVNSALSRASSWLSENHPVTDEPLYLGKQPVAVGPEYAEMVGVLEHY